jgi:hypothetical protein
MNPPHDPLSRLLEAAARAPEAAPSAPPDQMLDSVLRQWRARPVGDEFAPLLTLFRGAAIFAWFIMVLSVGAHYLTSRNEATATVPIAEYALTLQLPP